MLMLLENKPCDDKNCVCQLYCLHLKKFYVTLCLHNMCSFNYKIWQWINTGALFFHRLVLSIQATFLLTLPVPAKSLAACPFCLERHWWWKKKLSPILHSTLQKLAACGGIQYNTGRVLVTSSWYLEAKPCQKTGQFSFRKCSPS